MEPIIQFKLKERMDSCGVTRYALSKKTGLSYQVVDHYYRGDLQRIDRYVLAKLCWALQCQVQDILTICIDSCTPDAGPNGS